MEAIDEVITYMEDLIERGDKEEIRNFLEKYDEEMEAIKSA